MRTAKRMQLMESYKTIAFEDLVKRQERKVILVFFFIDYFLELFRFQ